MTPTPPEREMRHGLPTFPNVFPNSACQQSHSRFKPCLGILGREVRWLTSSLLPGPSSCRHGLNIICMYVRLNIKCMYVRLNIKCMYVRLNNVCQAKHNVHICRGGGRTVLSTDSGPECLREHFLKGKTIAPCGDNYSPPQGSQWDTLPSPHWDRDLPSTASGLL